MLATNQCGTYTLYGIMLKGAVSINNFIVSYIARLYSLGLGNISES